MWTEGDDTPQRVGRDRTRFWILSPLPENPPSLLGGGQLAGELIEVLLIDIPECLIEHNFFPKQFT